MKYLVLLLGDGEETPWGELDDDGRAEALRRFGEFDDACRTCAGVEILAGEALAGPHSAITLRTRGGSMRATAGPYSEDLVGLGGFYLVEAPDREVLTGLLALLPGYDMQVVPAVDPMA